MKRWMIGCLVFIVNSAFCQTLTVPEKLASAIKRLEADPELQHAAISLCVYDSKTADTIYTHNAQMGLAPASTQKIFTSCAAYDLLGKNYRYKTEIIYKFCKASPSRSYFVIKPSGDPTFGSARFDSTRAGTILKDIIVRMMQLKISPVSTQYVVNDSAYGNNTIPGGWIWEDIGNYYGASAQSLNWMENQYDIILRSGRSPGDKATAVKTQPAGLINDLRVNVTSAKKGSGDNTIVYPGYGAVPSSIEGTIPMNEDSFRIGASMQNPADVFIQQLNGAIKAQKLPMFYGFESHAPLLTLPDSMFEFMDVCRHVSPPFDSINYWFMQKSINLYGEALIKTMALEKSGFASTEKGVELLKDFWADRDVEKAALNIYDGSGLSPQNRVTADALVKALQYAKTRPWFKSFYFALPEHNGMKMKSGSIAGVKAYAGYQTSADGKQQYCFAVMINNYDGKPEDATKKIFKLLDNLK